LVQWGNLLGILREIKPLTGWGWAGFWLEKTLNLIYLTYNKAMGVVQLVVFEEKAVFVFLKQIKNLILPKLSRF